MTGIDRSLRDAGTTLVVGSVGAWLFWLVGFPAAVLTGPAALVSIAALTGLRMTIPPLLRDTVFVILGLQIGGTVTPEVIATAMAWPLSLLVLTVAMFVVIVLVGMVLRRGFGFDPMTALLAATPGHLSYVLGLSTALGADVARIALVQSVRVLLLTLAVPLLVAVFGVQGQVVAAPPAQMSALGLAVLVLLSLGLGRGFDRARVPAPLLMGAMVVSAIGQGTGATPGGLPPALIAAAFVCMGALIGTRFAGLDRRDLGQAFLAGLAATVIACLVAAVAAALAARIVGLPAAALLLAFAPGGVEVMGAIAIETGLEPAFVAAHHVFRLFALSFLVPILIARVPRG